LFLFVHFYTLISMVLSRICYNKRERCAVVLYSNYLAFFFFCLVLRENQCKNRIEKKRDERCLLEKMTRDDDDGTHKDCCRRLVLSLCLFLSPSICMCMCFSRKVFFFFFFFSYRTWSLLCVFRSLLIQVDTTI